MSARARPDDHGIEMPVRSIRCSFPAPPAVAQVGPFVRGTRLLETAGVGPHPSIWK